MAKTWAVKLPITGYLVLEVEADDEQDAIEKALDADYSYNDVESWEATEHVTRGNVTYAVLNDAEAELIDGGEEEEGEDEQEEETVST